MQSIFSIDFNNYLATFQAGKFEDVVMSSGQVIADILLTNWLCPFSNGMNFFTVAI